MQSRLLNTLLVKRCLYSGASSLVNFEVLKIFKAINGHVMIPNRYVVKDNKDNKWPPHLIGFKLGAYAKYIQRGMISNQFDDGVIRKLKELGFPTTYARMNFETLEIFKSIYGHLRIPIDYEIGEDGREGWPENLIGGKLGAYAVYLRRGLKFNTLSPKITKKLNDIMFPGDFKEVEVDAYRTVIGSISKASNDVDTSTNQFTSNERNIFRGNAIESITKTHNKYYVVKMYRDGLYGDKAKGLQEMGLGTSFSDARAQAILLAVKCYKSKYGHADISPRFKIDATDESWPPETRGLLIGSILKNIKCDGGHAHLHPQLIELGVNFELKRQFTTVCQALLVYKNIFGHVKVPRDYVIEKDDIRYPKTCRGMHLGIIICQVRNGKTFIKHKEVFQNLGVTYGRQIRGEITDDDVYSAVLVYKQIHGNVRILKKYVVPIDDTRYDEKIRGENLGARLHWLYKKRNSEFKQKLIELGVSYKGNPTNRGLFEVIFSALIAYKNINGHVEIPLNFVVPEDSSYPKIAWGLKLGESMARMRSFGSYAEHRKRLEDIGVNLAIRRGKQKAT